MYWTWDEVHTYIVHREFERKACKRLCDIVYKWKEDWKKFGEAAMPVGMDTEAWNGLVAYWQSKTGQDHSVSAKGSRNTPLAPGDLSSRHRLGQRPMAGLRLKMVRLSLNSST